MADLNNTQFYDLTPVEEPVKPPRFSRKRVLFALVGVVALVVITLLVVVVIRQFGGEEQPQINPEAIIQLERDLAACESVEDPETCKAQVRSEAARTEGDAAMCQSLTGFEYDNCVELVAREKTDASLCDLVSADSRATCRDAIVLLDAVARTDYARCADVISEEVQTSCENQLIPILIEEGRCVSAGVDEAVCTREAALDALITSGDVAGCLALTDQTTRDLCESIFQGTDRDGDGISDYEEVHTHGTDPNNPDTDGDGFEDGVEIENGFDPLT